MRLGSRDALEARARRSHGVVGLHRRSRRSGRPPAEALAFWRLALAAATLAVVALVGSRRGLLAPRGRLPALAALGAVQGAHWLLFFEAVKHGSVALAVLTFYAAPLVLAVVAPFVLPERWSPVVLALGVDRRRRHRPDRVRRRWGLGVGMGRSRGPRLGRDVRSVGCALEALLLAATPPLTIAFWDCFVGALVVAPALLLAGRVVPGDAGEWGAVLALGVLLTGISTLVYATLLRQVSAQAAGVLTFLEPVAGVALAWALLSEEPGAATLVGGALVLAGGVAVVLLDPSEPRVADAPAGVGSAQP